MKALLNLKFDLPHNKIIENSPASLEQLATIQIAVSLCYRAELTKSMTNDDKCKTKVILQNGISSLPIPPSIKDVVELMVAVTADQLYKIRLDASPHSEIFLSINSNLLQRKLQWTSQGTIDKKRTAQALAESSELNVKTRFEIAAEFYLEEQINALSVHLPRNYLEKHKRKFYSINEMKGLSIARKHFGILQPVSHSKDLFPFGVDEINCHYLWEHLTEAEKLDVYADSSCIYFPNVVLFLFSEASKEQKLQLLQNEEICSIIMKKLMDLEWLSVFNACIDEALKFLKGQTIVSLLHLSSYKIQKKRELFATKKKYAQVFCTLSDFLSATSLDSNDESSVAKSITCVLTVFQEERKMKVAKMILQSLQTEWIKKWFIQLIKQNLAELLNNACLELLDFIISFAFPSMREKQNLFNEIKYQLIDIIQPLTENNHLHELDELLTVFSDFQDIQNCKVNFAKKHGFHFCPAFLKSGHPEFVDIFVRWCFATEVDRNIFYKKFLRSREFRQLFLFHKSKKYESIVRFITMANLAKFISDDLYLHYVTLKAFQLGNSFDYEGLDKFFLSFFQYDQEKLIDLKKRWFISRRKNAYFLLPLRILYNNLLYNKFENEKHDISSNENLASEQVLIDDYFNWICSYDKEAKEKISEEFWHSKDTICFQQKDDR